MSNNPSVNMVNGRGNGCQGQQLNGNNYGGRNSFNGQCGGHQSGNQNGNRVCGRGCNNHPICQMCGKIGHTTNVRYNRYNKNFAPDPQPNRGHQNNSTPNNDQKPPNPAALMTTQNENPFLSAADQTIDRQWYADSGATNHVTLDYNVLTNPTKYGGNELLSVGNGDTSKMSHVGSSSLTNGQDLLKLNNVLYVPEISNNPVSMSKVAQDNNVFIKFHDSYYLIDMLACLYLSSKCYSLRHESISHFFI